MNTHDLNKLIAALMILAALLLGAISGAWIEHERERLTRKEMSSNLTLAFESCVKNLRSIK
jgi:uncharacterized protein YneF (UPF0154 family)